VHPTTEVRWWWRGRCPAGVRAWFRQLSVGGREEVRTDHYLVRAGADLGVKTREGRQLDVKELLGREADVVVAPDVVGTLERWVKWVFPLTADAPSGEALDTAGGAWLAVRKHRWLVDVGACELELAEVDIAGDAWWTLALEAVGTDPVGLARLEKGLAELLGPTTPAEVDLAGAGSCGYPAQLERLLDGEG
jgi:hypothetical protein